eukprot:1394788-Pyramimonas_sp.AAC.1
MDEGDRPSTGGDPAAAFGARAGSGGEEPTEVERKETGREPTYLVDLEENHSAKESDSAEEPNSDSSANGSSRGSKADRDSSDREDAASGAE